MTQELPETIQDLKQKIYDTVFSPVVRSIGQKMIDSFKPHWTHDKPKADGYQWIRRAMDDGTITTPWIVEYDAESQEIISAGSLAWEPVDKCMQFWSEPITKPEH